MLHDPFKRLNEDLKDLDVVDIQRWLITADGVKRQYWLPNGKRCWQRLPRALWRDLNEFELKALVSRLNFEDWRVQEALAKYEIKSSFIPDNTLTEFEKKLFKESKPQTAKYAFRNLKKYCLEYFLPKSPSPIVWQKDLQNDWVDYLISLDLAPSTYKHIKTALNKFMAFLATKNPDIPVLAFKGITPYQISEIRYQREVRGLGIRRFISSIEYSKIYEAADVKLKPYIAIAYGYGLRRNELRALRSEHVKKGYLAVDAQLLENQTLALPKYRKKRKVPHWMMKPDYLLAHIKSFKPYESGPKLSEAFTNLTTHLYQNQEIDAAYVLHDCRHSFVSNAANKYALHDVMMAAGHSDLRTTSTYLKDTKALDDEVFDPESA